MDWKDWVALSAIPVFFGVVVLVWIALTVRRKNRTAAIRQTALSLGMTFLESDTNLKVESFFRFPLFQRWNFRGESRCKSSK